MRACATLRMVTKSMSAHPVMLDDGNAATYGDAHEACFHCGEPLPVGSAWTIDIDGRARRLCCVGCQAAAAAIVGFGLADYYRVRETPALRAEHVADSVA